jgi:hypothetical protein
LCLARSGLDEELGGVIGVKHDVISLGIGLVLLDEACGRNGKACRQESRAGELHDVGDGG